MPIKIPRGKPLAKTPQPPEQVAELAKEPAKSPTKDEAASPPPDASADTGPAPESPDPEPRDEAAPEKTPTDPKTEGDEVEADPADDDDLPPLGAFIPSTIAPSRRMAIIRAEMEWRAGFLGFEQIAQNAGIHPDRIWIWRRKYKWPRRTDLKARAALALRKATINSIAETATGSGELDMPASAVETKAEAMLATWARSVATMQSRQRGIVDDLLTEAQAYYRRALEVCAFFRSEVERGNRSGEGTLDATSKELRLFRLAVDTLDTVFKMQYRAWGLKADGSGASDDDGADRPQMPNSYEEFIAMAEARGESLVQ